MCCAPAPAIILLQSASRRRFCVIRTKGLGWRWQTPPLASNGTEKFLSTARAACCWPVGIRPHQPRQSIPFLESSTQPCFRSRLNRFREHGNRHRPDHAGTGNLPGDAAQAAKSTSPHRCIRQSVKKDVNHTARASASLGHKFARPTAATTRSARATFQPVSSSWNGKPYGRPGIDQQGAMGLPHLERPITTASKPTRSTPDASSI